MCDFSRSIKYAESLKRHHRGRCTVGYPIARRHVPCDAFIILIVSIVLGVVLLCLLVKLIVKLDVVGVEVVGVALCADKGIFLVICVV